MSVTDLQTTSEIAPGSCGRLPNSAYTDLRYFERECNTVLSSTWQFAGRASAIPNAGDSVLASVAGSAIFLMRQKSGEVSAFYNVCPHRGAKVMPAACQSAHSITCPYHNWNFSLDGQLRGRPHFYGADQHDRASPDDDVERPSLWAIRTALFFDWVFVNLDGTAPPLERFLAPLIDRLHGFDCSGCVFGGELSFDVPTNWKLAHENFFDILHKIAIHPELQEAAPIQTNVRYEWVEDIALTSHVVKNPTEGRGDGLPGLPGFPEKLRELGISAHLYPNANVQIWDGQITLFTCTPVAPDRTLETFSVYFSAEAMASRYAAAREEVFNMWRQLNNQDIQPLIWMQEARGISIFDGGSFSPYWDEVIAQYVERLKVSTPASPKS